jgi:hypothetical protein
MTMRISRKKQIEILEQMSDEEIDYSDIPPLTSEQMSKMVLFTDAVKVTTGTEHLEELTTEGLIGFLDIGELTTEEYVAKIDAETFDEY